MAMIAASTVGFTDSQRSEDFDIRTKTGHTWGRALGQLWEDRLRFRLGWRLGRLMFG